MAEAAFDGRKAWGEALSQNRFEAHRRRAFGLALKVTGNREAAEDVVQEAMLRAHRSKAGLRGDEWPWLRRIVVRCSADHLAKPAHTVAREDVGVAPRFNEDLAVRLVLEKLPIDQQLILALAIGEGLSYNEIADTLEINIGTVGSRLHAAKAAFRKLWEDLP